MTRADLIRMSGYWGRLAKLGMDHPDDVHALFDAFRDMRAEGETGLDLLIDELFDDPSAV
ncbi:hypothetical protein [Kitasatospora purpeofusca]|uniref:Uncharacterized protein n=1 Tax=Kitasatospora purpeofusca TaxID=67352 RepID=A0ABZ1TUG2_9ACTN|nr:hypothetical protein [Kitasatospora purpeofusca]